jgi:hypothetical protein
MQRRHNMEVESLKQAHADQLAALRRQQHDSVYLNSLAKQVWDHSRFLFGHENKQKTKHLNFSLLMIS